MERHCRRSSAPVKIHLLAGASIHRRLPNIRSISYMTILGRTHFFLNRLIPRSLTKPTQNVICSTYSQVGYLNIFRSLFRRSLCIRDVAYEQVIDTIRLISWKKQSSNASTLTIMETIIAHRGYPIESSDYLLVFLHLAYYLDFSRFGVG